MATGYCALAPQDIKFNVHAHPTLSEVLDELFKQVTASGWGSLRGWSTVVLHACDCLALALSESVCLLRFLALQAHVDKPASVAASKAERAVVGAH